MKKAASILGLIMSMGYAQSIWAAGIEGRWTTIDDKTGKKRAIVEIKVSDGILSGTIVEVYKQPGDTGICQKCPGPFKNKPLKGLRFVWGLKQKNSNTWGGGQILDPKTGQVYNVKMTLKGNTLVVRGYVGMSLLGRTQQWIR